MSEADDLRRIVDPQCHEYAANYNYNHAGLRPWFAFDRAVKDGGGSVTTEVDALGDRWEVKLYYQDSAIQPPGETPAGTTVEHDQIREFRLRATALDEVRQKKVNFHIRPRWADMEAEKDDGTTVEIPVPDELANHRTDAVNVRVNGSNIPFDEYNQLLEAAAEAVDVSSHYFDAKERHRTSNVQDAARYVRLHTDLSGPVHGRTGPLVGLAHVLENDRSGYRKLVQNDDDNHGQNLPGFYHTATLGPDRVQEVLPNHRLPVECKHYYESEALDRPRSDPLRHPKLEVAYQSSRWDDTVYADPEEVAALVDELDEWLYAILNDAGLDLRAGGDTYVSDEYFDAENATTTASVVDLDLTEVRHEQESVVYRHLVDGMSPAEKESLQVLVTDGGQVSPGDIADITGRHQDTVYDALGRMHDLVDHQYGQVDLKSTYLSELVADALDQAEAAIERATMASAKAVHAADRGLDDRTSAFIAWCEKYGLNYSDDDDRTTFELGQVEGADEVRKILREGLNRWEAMGRDPATFRTGKVRFRKETGATYNYLPDDDRVKQNYADVFRFL